METPKELREKCFSYNDQFKLFMKALMLIFQVTQNALQHLLLNT